REARTTITQIMVTNPTVIAANGLSFTPGDDVEITDPLTTGGDDGTYFITFIDADHFSIRVHVEISVNGGPETEGTYTLQITAPGHGLVSGDQIVLEGLGAASLLAGSYVASAVENGQFTATPATPSAVAAGTIRRGSDYLFATLLNTTAVNDQDLVT